MKREFNELVETLKAYQLYQPNDDVDNRLQDLSRKIECYDELTDRELAMRWWNRKSDIEKTQVLKLVDNDLLQRNPNSLTGSEIEWVWRNQPHNK